MSFGRTPAHRLLFVVAFICGSISANAQAVQQFADLGDLKLENGQVIRNCKIGYRTFGVLDAERSNAVLFPTWFGGKAADLEGSIGQGRLLDSAGLYIVAVDSIGNGVSSSPSNSKEQSGDKFPAYTIRDMVESQYRLLTETLKIQHLRAVVGISMGGMQAFEWMVSHPTFMSRVIPIVGTPKQTARDLLLWKSQLRTIRDHRGSADSVTLGMKAVARIHLLALRTAAYDVARVKPEDTDKQLETQEREVAGRDAEDWASQLGAMIGHDIYKPFDSSEDRVDKLIRAKVLVIVVTTDQMVNPTPALRFAERTKSKSLALTNDGGHLGLSLENDRLITAVREFIYARD
jgi:homoserine O-acetyltransferase/O-succinyltransferase